MNMKGSMSKMEWPAAIYCNATDRTSGFGNQALTRRIPGADGEAVLKARLSGLASWRMREQTCPRVHYPRAIYS